MKATAAPPHAGLYTMESQRYARQVCLAEIGLGGQQKLKASSVLLVGLGGLGCPAALYLAAAGVGHLGLVDADSVERSNLHRQVLHTESTLGQAKVDSAAIALRQSNPHIELTRHRAHLTAANATTLCRPYDVIVDGTDNVAARYALADACATLAKPTVYASIQGFWGQLSTFDACQGPCYRCLYPQAPPPGAIQTCHEAGVLGVLCGTLGVLQATETLKVLLDLGDTLVGRLLHFDALAMRFDELKISKSATCSTCGQQDFEDIFHPNILYQSSEATLMSDDITPQDLKKRLQEGPVRLIDVREPFEWDIAHIQGGELMPLGQLPERLAELPRDQEIVLYCKSGGRSQHALEFLRSQGFTRLKNLAGGINRWSRDVDPSVPLY